jgi:hypothetical protein
MFDKMKKYVKGKNPYLLASYAVVFVSLLVIVFLVRADLPAEEEPNTAEVLVEVEESQETGADEELPEKTEAVIEVVTESTKETVAEESQEENNAEPEQPSEQEIKESFPKKDELPKKESFETVEETVVEEPKEPEENPEKPAEPDEPSQMETQPSKEPEVIPEEKTEPVPKDTPKEPEVPEEHEHSWIFESYYQKPTCSNGGLVNQICAHCGETQTTVGTPTGEHQFKVETPGDCCNVEVIICSECNHREVREKDPDKHIDEEDGFCYGCGQKTE